ncbi:MAG: hypothetical protein JW820_19925 [Spirochaetales bacterium]|nr:hypothetical protein [Spirochaetales bacterium]
MLLGRGLLVFAAAWAVTGLARRLSSETRHLIWMGAIGSFVIIPVAWLTLPPLHFGSWFPAEPRVFYSIAVAPAVSHQEYLRLAQEARDQALWSGMPHPGAFGGLALPLLAV